MLRHTDRTDTRSPSSVGNAERLVQIQMADVSSIGTGTTQTHLSIEIGPIEVHLTAVTMHDVADAANRRLKHAVG